MSFWIKGSIVALVVFAAIWGGVIFWWRAGSHSPAMSEMVLYLLVLPVAVLALFGVFASASDRKSAQQAPAVGAVPDVDPNSDPNADPARHERQWTLQLVASAVRSLHGATPAEAAEAMAGQTASLALDPLLKDANGYPILSGRIPAVDERMLSGELQPWLAANSPGREWTEQEIRTLVLIADVTDELALKAAGHPLLAQYRSAPLSARDSIQLPDLRVATAMPGWIDVRHEALHQLVCGQITKHGWPAEKIRMIPLTADTDHDSFQLIDRLSVEMHRQAVPTLGILVAARSGIGQDTVSKWEAAGRLLTAANKSGRIPGEGAAGLLVADTEQGGLIADGPRVMLHRVSAGRRKQSIDAPGRTSAELAIALAADAMDAAKTGADRIACLIADSDHRANRLTELALTGTEVLPELDDQACIKVEAACGDLGTVASLMSLALAHDRAASSDMAVLCISNRDSFLRSAVVVASAGIHEDEADATASSTASSTDHA